jgi:uncharacterized Zn finger protein
MKRKLNLFCPKCGTDDVHRRYRFQDDMLECACRICGYEFAKIPLTRRKNRKRKTGGR